MADEFDEITDVEGRPDAKFDFGSYLWRLVSFVGLRLAAGDFRGVQVLEAALVKYEGVEYQSEVAKLESGERGLKARLDEAKEEQSPNRRIELEQAARFDFALGKFKLLSRIISERFGGQAVGGNIGEVGSF